MNILKKWPWVLLIVATIGCYFWDRTRYENEINAREILADQQHENEIRYYRNRDSSMVAHVKATQVTEDNMKLILGQNQNLTEQVGDLKKVVSFLSSSFQATGIVRSEITKEFYVRDSTHIDTIHKWSFNDGYLTMNCQSSNDSAYCGYSYSDTVQAVTWLQPAGRWWQFWKWFRPPTATTEVWFQNKSAKATQVESVVRKK